MVITSMMQENMACRYYFFKSGFKSYFFIFDKITMFKSLKSHSRFLSKYFDDGSS